MGGGREGGGSETKDHPQLHSKPETSLDYIDLSQKKKWTGFRGNSKRGQADRWFKELPPNVAISRTYMVEGKNQQPLHQDKLSSASLHPHVHIDTCKHAYTDTHTRKNKRGKTVQNVMQSSGWE